MLVRLSKSLFIFCLLFPSSIVKGILKFWSRIMDLFIFLVILSVFASCILKFYYQVHIHLGLYGLLINGFLSYYEMIFFVPGNILCCEIYFENDIVIPDFLQVV